MASDEKTVWDVMRELVGSGKTYHFECIDDEGDYEPFEGKPLKIVGDSFLVEITKDNGEVKKGNKVWVEVDDLCFMEIKEV